MDQFPTAVAVIDSHTEGEPTRVVLNASALLGDGELPQILHRFRTEHDALRRAILTEPRGSEVLVGAMLLESDKAHCQGAVIFFNNVGYLGMCGHGLIGVVQTLAHLGRIRPGPVRLDTPVGEVEAELGRDGAVTLANVPAWRYRRRVQVAVPGLGTVHGDIAWGGNWFYLCQDHGLALVPDNLETLLGASRAIMAALSRQGITGAEGAAIDHVELLGPGDKHCDGRNFVLCPGGEWDRSPCGTGTSAKLACLAADGLLAEGQCWRQASLTGGLFQGRFEKLVDGRIRPLITGRAHVVARAELIFGAEDPYRLGLLP
ncbi:proline racemase family protein [Gallaecimonas sp. GXIMD4217]|uniref:proline racemase family protein n=1 Tax=Gallaecimonas sp. GXIMD4217 TaxID=3131927 RepID=UPI00311AF03B